MYKPPPNLPMGRRRIQYFYKRQYKQHKHKFPTTMTDKVILNFNMLFPLMMGGIIDGITPDVDDSVTEDDESVVEEFRLKQPCELSDLLDIVEDNTDFTLVYICKRTDISDGKKHVCAVTNATNGHMNKINFIADVDGKVTSIVATIYESQDVFGSETIRDLKQHIAQKFFFEYRIAEEELAQLVW